MADGPDMMSMLPMLISMATAGQSGSTPGGYEPSHSPAGFNFNNNAGRLSSILTAGGSLGDMGGMAPFADMFGMMFAPDLMRKLQSGAGVDQIALQRQRQVQGEMMRFATTVPGRTVIEGLGMDPNSGAGQMAEKALPFISMFAPELSSSIMSAISPNYMSMTGAQRLMSAGAIQDQHGRIEPGLLGSMVDTLDRLGKTDRGFRDDRFMHGFSRDSFANFVQFAADQGEVDMDMDRPAVRRETRERLRKSRFGGRADDALTEDERNDLDAATQQGVESEGLLRSASIHAKIGRQIQRMAPGLSNADTLAFMNDAGLVASNANEGEAITDLLRKLEALGNATGTTTQQLINAGRTLTAQTGGSLMFNMEVAGTAKMAERLGMEASREERLNTTPGAEAAGTQRAMDAMAQWNRSGFGRMDAAVFLHGSEEDKAALMEAKKAGPDALLKFYNEIDTGSTERGRKFQGIHVSQAEQAWALTGINLDEEHAGLDPVKSRAALMLAQGMKFLGGASGPLGKLQAQLGADKFNQLLMRSNQGIVDSDIQKSLGLSDDQMNLWLQANKMGGAQTDVIRGLGAGLVGADANALRNRDDVALRKATEAIGEELSAQTGAGQGIIPNIRAGNIGSFSDVLQSMGYKTTDRMAAVMGGLTEQQNKNFVAAGRKRAAALEVLDNPSATTDMKDKAHAMLQEAAGILGTFNVQEKDERAKRELGLDDQSQALKASNAVLDGSPAPMASGPAALAGAMPGGTTAGARKENDGKQNAKLEIDLKVNGAKLDHTSFDMRASEVNGYREVVVNGKPVSTK